MLLYKPFDFCASKEEVLGKLRKSGFPLRKRDHSGLCGYNGGLLVLCEAEASVGGHDDPTPLSNHRYPLNIRRLVGKMIAVQCD